VHELGQHRQPLA